MEDEASDNFVDDGTEDAVTQEIKIAFMTRTEWAKKSKEDCVLYS